MYKINKSQAEYIRGKSPSTCMYVTSKEKPKGKRKKYYVEETKVVKELLKQYESEKVELVYG